MLGGECAELAVEFFERRFGVAHPEVARLLEGGQRFGDAGDGELVGVDVEVVYCVVYELCFLLSFVVCMVCVIGGTYCGGIF